MYSTFYPESKYDGKQSKEMLRMLKFSSYNIQNRCCLDLVEQKTDIFTIIFRFSKVNNKVINPELF